MNEIEFVEYVKDMHTQNLNTREDFLEAFEKGIEAAYEERELVNDFNHNVINWVAIETNKAPELCTDVLVCYKNGDVLCRFFDGDGRFYNIESDLDVTENISHWAKLPEPPCL